MSTDWLGTGSFSLTPTVAGADALTNPTVAELFALAYVYNGSTWDRLRGSTTNGLYADLRALAGNTISTGNGASGTGVQRVTIANDSTGVVGLNAGTNLIGKTVDAPNIGVAYNGTTSLTVTYTPIAAATSGDNTLLAGTSAKKTYVLAMALVASAAVNLYIKDGTSGTVIFGGSTNKVQLAANGGFVLPYNPIGWFANATTNQALVMNLSGAVAVSGTLVTVTF